MVVERVGIITQYYKSHNYGGLLQAYALTTVLKQLGYSAEQIAYDTADDNYYNMWEAQVISSHSEGIKSRIKSLVRAVLEFSIRNELNKRFNSMEHFGYTIPHSEAVYTQETTTKLQKKYTHFVVGSDQVWNPQFYAPVYFCDFAKKTSAKCISYAASVSQNQLTKRQAEIYKEHMKNFSAISLRENNTEIIQELTDTKVN